MRQHPLFMRLLPIVETAIFLSCRIEGHPERNDFFFVLRRKIKIILMRRLGSAPFRRFEKQAG